jgi:hypothetical protein
VGTQEIRALLEEKINSDPPVCRYGSFGHELVRELMDAHDALARSYESACSELAGLRHELGLQRELLEKRTQDTRRLRERLLAEEGRVTHFSQELRRVKDGRLTEEEFQAICHNLSPDDEERFVRGCYATWQLLFKRVELRQVVEILGIKSEDLGVQPCSSGQRAGGAGNTTPLPER